jgi:hypothetical protein
LAENKKKKKKIKKMNEFDRTQMEGAIRNGETYEITTDGSANVLRKVPLLKDVK